MDPVKDKIRKLLALAAGGTEHEAESAMKFAQRLMDLHRITELELSESTPGIDEKISEDPNPLFSSGRLPKWKIQLAAVLAEFNNCRVLITPCDRKHNRPNTEVNLYGRPSDTQHVHYLLAFIVVELTRISKISCMGEGHKYFDSWFHGAVAGLRVKLDEGRKEVLALVTSKMTLVKFDTLGKNVDQFIEDNIKVKKTKAKLVNHDLKAWKSGFESGKKVDVGKPKEE